MLVYRLSFTLRSSQCSFLSKLLVASEQAPLELSRRKAVEMVSRLNIEKESR